MIFSIIIVNYKQKEFVVNCINSIKENLNCVYEIIVVNNSPDYDSIEIPGITVIENSNKGFSHANNLAAKSASGKYLFFLNADTILKRDLAAQFLYSFDRIGFGVVGISLRYPNGKSQLSYWNENTFINELKNKKLERANKEDKPADVKVEIGYDVIKEIDWVSGAAMVVNKSVFDKINGFDEDYFLFYEDADLCKRINSIGDKIFYFPFDGLVHFKGENVNKSFQSDTYFYSKKSQLLYYKKHNNIVNRFLLRFYLLMKFSIRCLFNFNKINYRILKLVLGVPYD